MSDIDLIIESFERNGRVNSALLSALEMSDLAIDDEAGGWDIGKLLGEMAAFRYGWLTRVSPRHADSVPSVVDGNETDFWLTVKSIGELQEGFDAGDKAVLEAVLSAVDEGRKFQGVYESHPVHLIQHTIVHDSHHRGQIMTLLRQAGRSPEARQQLEQETWPIWRE